MGHPYVILLVLVCQSLVYKEVTALFELRDQKKTAEDPWSKTLNWYFFVVTNYFLYGESIIYYFKHIVFVDAWFIPFARNHRFISFMLYVVGEFVKGMADQVSSGLLPTCNVSTYASSLPCFAGSTLRYF